MLSSTSMSIFLFPRLLWWHYLGELCKCLTYVGCLDKLSLIVLFACCSWSLMNCFLVNWTSRTKHVPSGAEFVAGLFCLSLLWTQLSLGQGFETSFPKIKASIGLDHFRLDLDIFRLEIIYLCCLKMLPSLHWKRMCFQRWLNLAIVEAHALEKGGSRQRK